MKKVNLKNPLRILRQLGQNPRTDWHCMLISFVLCLIIIFFLNVFLYDRLSFDDGDTASISDPSIKIPNGIELDEVIKALNQRELDSEDISEIILTDPAF